MFLTAAGDFTEKPSEAHVFDSKESAERTAAELHSVSAFVDAHTPLTEEDVNTKQNSRDTFVRQGSEHLSDKIMEICAQTLGGCEILLDPLFDVAMYGLMLSILRQIGRQCRVNLNLQGEELGLLEYYIDALRGEGQDFFSSMPPASNKNQDEEHNHNDAA
jgi:1-aminocyclopropane-1-carboxylate deaminase/D-cysteine desulfhydrase-like pyridoxal-dependent ACC family enzyme